MSRRHRNANELAQYAAAVEVFTAEGGHLPPDEGERQMDELGVRRDASDYFYKGYRPSAAPTGTERVLMASLGIQFDGRTFRFAGCRYDRLTDAVNHARRADATDSH
jgi:hypothetical protein